MSSSSSVLPVPAKNDPPYKPTSWWRIAKLTAFVVLTCGLGALWLWGRTVTVSPGKVGTVTNDLTGQMSLLQPGMHVIESPFSTFNGQFPNASQVNMKLFENLKVVTADGPEISTSVDLRYTIDDPIELTKRVNGPYEKALSEAISSSLSNLICVHGYTYSQLTSARIPQVELDMSSQPLAESKSLSSVSSAASLPTKATSTTLSLAAQLLESIQKFCKSWGINVSFAQIIDPKPTNALTEQRYQENANTIIRENNAYACTRVMQARLTMEAKGNMERIAMAADAEANKIKTIAQAKATETAIATEAQVNRLNRLTEALRVTPELGAKVMTLDTHVAIAEKLPKGTIFNSPLSLFPSSDSSSSRVVDLNKKSTDALASPR